MRPGSHNEDYYAGTLSLYSRPCNWLEYIQVVADPGLIMRRSGLKKIISLQLSSSSVGMVTELYEAILLFMATMSLESLTWWCHEMEMLSNLLSLCVGNMLVTGGIPSQRSNNMDLWCFFDVILKNCLRNAWVAVIWDAMTNVTLIMWSLLWCPSAPSMEKDHHRGSFGWILVLHSINSVLSGTQYTILALKQKDCHSSWWRHQVETFSALLAICAGNSPVPGEFPVQRPVTRSFDVFFDLRLNKQSSKQSWGWWFETLSGPLWRHRNGYLKITGGIKGCFCHASDAPVLKH